MAERGGHAHDEPLSNKSRRWAKAAGREVLEKALWLHFAMKRKDCPAWARAAIVGALGYFLLPLDAIPDFIPVAGFTDDLGVLAAAVAAVAKRIDPGVRAQAEEKLAAWGLGRRAGEGTER